MNEDSLTETLASHLRLPKIRDLFLEFLFGEHVPSVLKQCTSFDVQTQYRFSESSRQSVQVGSRGRLDLLIVGTSGRSTFAVAVEHKVWDEEKPSRLHNYRLLLDGEPFTQSWLFEIVRERDYEIESEGYVVKVRLWRDLDRFLAGRASTLSNSERKACQVIHSAIEAAGGLAEGRITRGRRLSVGLTAESCLDALVEELHGIEARKVRDRGVSVHIRAGLPRWTKEHLGHWHHRLWIYVKEPSPGVFGFQMQLIFHNANFTDIGFAVQRLPKWAPVFVKNGLHIFRGPDKGWDGAKRLRVAAPYSILSRPKYFYAEEPDANMIGSTTEHQGIEGLIESGAERARRYLELFDAVYAA